MKKKEFYVMSRVTEDMKAQLDKISSDTGESQSLILRDALHEYLEKHCGDVVDENGVNKTKPSPRPMSYYKSRPKKQPPA